VDAFEPLGNPVRQLGEATSGVKGVPVIGALKGAELDGIPRLAHSLDLGTRDLNRDDVIRRAMR
jgi:hypothetical protein